MHIKILGWLFLNGEITDDLFTFYFLFIYFPLIFFFFLIILGWAPVAHACNQRLQRSGRWWFKASWGK
jgi:hypothetical protein